VITQSLTLSLLVLGILFIDHINPPFAADDLAIRSPFLNWCSDFHCILLCSVS